MARQSKANTFKSSLKQGEKDTLSCNDPSWTLQEWKCFIEEQISFYGPRSILSTDAGANNVQLVVEKRH